MKYLFKPVGYPRRRVQITMTLLFVIVVFLFPEYVIAKEAARPDKSWDSSQVKSIKGTVKDDLGEPLIGASILVKGTQNGVSTDDKGAFHLEVPGTSSILVISFTGYQTKEIMVGTQEVLNISMLPEENALNEVVVVGYGTVRRSEITGASSTVSANEIAKRPLTRMEQALQGTTAGVAATSRNGQPGQGMAIRIRGANSITGSNEPLYVIDGNIGSGSDVNVADIESVDILKDAASTAIYGSRGSNGVVMITTKSGKTGKPVVNFSTWFQKAMMPRKLDLMNAYDFARSVNAQFASTGSRAAFSDEKLEDLRVNGGTDWQEALHTKPWVQNYQLDVSGGTEAAKYRLSLGYLNQPGIILNQSYKRTSFRGNVDTKINDKLNLKFILAATIPQNHNNTYAGGLSDPFNQAVEWDPTSPIRDPNTGAFITNSSYASIQFNPVAQALSQSVDNINTDISGTGTLTYNILDNLTFTSTNVYSIGNGYGQTLQGPGTNDYNNKTDYAQASPSRTRNYLSSNYLTYDRTFNDHAFTATALYEISAGNNMNVNALSRNLISYATGYYNLGLGGTQQTSSGYTEDALVSYMGRINYSYKDKYFVMASVRTDGSSHLTEKYSTFPAVGLRWNAAKEAFLQNSKVISGLSLRASYGETGNQAVGAFATIPQIIIDPAQPNYFFDGVTPSVATALGTPVSQLLRWETKTSYDVGADVSFFGNRLNLTIDAYKSTIKDLLYNNQATAYNGGGLYSKNIGSIENKGIEFALGGMPVNSGDFQWSTNVNLSLNRNKVIDLGGLDDVIVGGVTGQSVLRVGAPLGEFYGFDFLGTWKNAEAAEAAKYGMKPGDAKYADINGDYAYTAADYTPIGNATPSFTFGFTNDFSYKNFSLNIMFQGSKGNQIFSQTLAYLWGGLGDMKNATIAEAVPENLWTPENETDNPAWSNTGKNYNLSSRYVYDASFIKLKNLSLSYQFSTNWLSSIKARSLEIYVSTQNLFTITGYKGYDPEVENGSSEILLGQEFGVIPNPKTYTFGLKLGL